MVDEHFAILVQDPPPFIETVKPISINSEQKGKPEARGDLG
jgi:hypothetical protein